MTNNLSIRHLRAFIEVAQSGSFTRAAEHLHLTQSTLTATVKQLEEQVGLTLLDRTTRRVLLSAAGQGFLPVAERLVSDFDTSVRDLQATAQQQQGHVAIAASPSVTARLLPPVVSEYHRQQPNIAVSLFDHSASVIEKQVLNNEVDFGIGGNHSNHSELLYQPLLLDRFGVVMAPERCLLRHKEGIGWQQLATEPLVHLSSDTGIRAQLSKLGEDVAFSIRSAKLEASSPAGVAALVREGLGMSVLPALAASTAMFDGLEFQPLEEPAIFRDIHIISRRGRTLSPAANALLEQLLRYLAQAPLPPHVIRHDEFPPLRS